jgi:KDO2-lipid IV(A) lauroyltransferase
MMKRSLGRLFTWLGIGLLHALSYLPYGVVARFGEGLGSLLYRLPSRRKNVVQTNLGLCFPEKSVAEREALARDTFRMVFRSFAERGIFWCGSDQQVRRWVEVNDQANLPALYGTPHIIVNLHLAGVEAGGIRVTQYLRDHQLAGHSLYTTQSNRLMDAHMKKWRGRFGGHMMARTQNTRDVVRMIRKGEVMQLIADMDFGARDSVFVPFFGVPAASLAAVSRLARLTNAKVIFAYTEMLADYRGYRVHLLPPETDFPSEDVVADTRRMNAFFESVIRPRIAEYYWVHKRFKTRPPGEPSVY